MIREGKLSEIVQLLAITTACAAKMTHQKVYQWNSEYPNQKAFQLDVERGELFVLIASKKIIGCITISEEKDLEYNQVDWLTKDAHHYYIHRLAIHPDFQQRGHAKMLMDFAENKAAKKNIASIRLDTFSQNLRNQKFYLARGYIQTGEIYFPRQSNHPFFCYELIVT